jgi:hypothetical protein
LRVGLPTTQIAVPTRFSVRTNMALTQFAIQHVTAADKLLKLSDGDGLSLLVQPNGAKLWRFRYRYLGKENMLSLGVFPTVSLLDARRKRDEIKKLLSEGIDPSQQRRLERIRAVAASQNTFGGVAAEFLANMEANKLSTRTLEKNRWLLEGLAASSGTAPLRISPRPSSWIS